MSWTHRLDLFFDTNSTIKSIFSNQNISFPTYNPKILFFNLKKHAAIGTFKSTTSSIAKLLNNSLCKNFPKISQKKYLFQKWLSMQKIWKITFKFWKIFWRNYWNFEKFFDFIDFCAFFFGNLSFYFRFCRTPTLICFFFLICYILFTIWTNISGFFKTHCMSLFINLFFQYYFCLIFGFFILCQIVIFLKFIF